MPLAIGIVGLPNVGKSTLFSALTKKQVSISNYPFCTIDPNVGVVKVPDQRLEQLAALSKSARILPTTIDFIDIAGLIKGAHSGEGLGNQFLSHIRECDAICQVVRGFEDKNIIHVSGLVDPPADMETVNLELIFADLATVEKRLNKAIKEAKSGDKAANQLKVLLERLQAWLEQGKPVRRLELKPEEITKLKELNLLTAKPMIYVLNSNQPEATAKAPAGERLVALNVKLEAEIAALPEAEQQEYIKELGLKQSGLDKLIKVAYQTLNLITFLTTGPEETRAWTVKQGAKAPQAAGVIHTDFEQGFIRAEVVNWQELIRAGGEARARQQGLLRTEGKDYIMQDGDVCHFLFSK